MEEVIDRAEIGRLTDLIMELFKQEDASPANALIALGTMVETTIRVGWEQGGRMTVAEVFTKTLHDGLKRKVVH